MRPIGPLFLAIFRKLAETVFDDGHGVDAAFLDWLVGEYADMSRAFGPKTKLAFCGSALAIQLLPLFVVGVPLPMTWLPKRLRVRYLEKLEAGPLTVLVTATKVPLTMVAFEHPDLMASTGYDGRPMKLLADDDAALPATARKARLPTLPPAADAKEREAAS